MASKSKKDWANEIRELESNNKGLLGDIDPETLEDEFTVGQLKALLKDMKSDLDGATNIKVPDDTKEPESKFNSMCGSEFNPKKAGECYKQCQNDFPEAFQACLDNYKESTVVKKKNGKKASLGKTAWGHMNGKQGGLIDEFFLNNSSPGTLEEICEFCGGKEARVMHHMRHLVADLDIALLYNDREVEQEDGSIKKVKQYWWKEKDKRRKGEELEGKSAYNNK